MDEHVTPGHRKPDGSTPSVLAPPPPAPPAPAPPRKKKTRDGLDLLQYSVVFTIVGLFIFVNVINVLDDIAFGDKFKVDPAFFVLMTGLIGALFTGKLIASMRPSSEEDEDD